MRVTAGKWRGEYILVDGEPVPEPSLVRWCRWWNIFENRRIAEDEIGPARVSTVFLGLDHNWGFKGGPILFETMVFWTGSPLDEDCVRYRTLEEAKRGHQEMCALVRAHL